VILHVTPDAASGGNLALVQNGDRIRLSVHEKRIDLLVSDDTLAQRRTHWHAPKAPSRGYAQLYFQHVMQADLGCDFDFLRAAPTVK